jgi:hypothetical protein
LRPAKCLRSLRCQRTPSTCSVCEPARLRTERQSLAPSDETTWFAGTQANVPAATTISPPRVYRLGFLLSRCCQTLRLDWKSGAAAEAPVPTVVCKWVVQAMVRQHLGLGEQPQACCNEHAHINCEKSLFSDMWRPPPPKPMHSCLVQ